MNPSQKNILVRRALETIFEKSKPGTMLTLTLKSGNVVILEEWEMEVASEDGPSDWISGTDSENQQQIIVLMEEVETLSYEENVLEQIQREGQIEQAQKENEDES